MAEPPVVDASPLVDVPIAEARLNAASVRYAHPMSPTAKELLAQALHLDEAERATLAGALIESLHPEAEAGAEEAWERVIERRVHELEAGTAETVPRSEVRARLFRGFE